MPNEAICTQCRLCQEPQSASNHIVSLMPPQHSAMERRCIYIRVCVRECMCMGVCGCMCACAWGKINCENIYMHTYTHTNCKGLVDHQSACVQGAPLELLIEIITVIFAATF